MDCKHDWHFTDDGTMAMRCKKCGQETGPRTAEQLAQDMMQDVLTTGSAWSRGGERIDPTTVYKLYEPPKSVGAWVIDPSPDEGHGPSTMFHVFRKPTDEQIKNTEQAFGWKWKDLA